ncbi:hypothetical protein [Pseudonocardia nigra]|uniref:hypothetical protein n=1 Tax=Pseudonocardia nigra TaxID=1921578 RepID=UPI001C5F6E9A|nr:hypothetical protein [Pseudonocardia nigra]
MNTRIGAALVAVVVLLPILVLAAVQGAVTSVFGASSPSPNALAHIPADYLALYRQAATTCPGLDWSVLAAVGKVETDHGRSALPGVRDGENPSGAGDISGSLLALRHVRIVGDTPRAGEVSAGCEP